MNGEKTGLDIGGASEIIDVLRDREWRRAEWIIEQVGHNVSPERAFKKFRQVVQDSERYPDSHQVQAGRGQLVQASISHLIGAGRIQIDSSGPRKGPLRLVRLNEWYCVSCGICITDAFKDRPKHCCCASCANKLADKLSEKDSR